MSVISVDASAFQSLQEALGLLKGELEKKDKHIEDLRLHTATLNQEITRLNGELERTREELRAGNSTSGVAAETGIGLDNASIGESAQESLVPEKDYLDSQPEGSHASKAYVLQGGIKGWKANFTSDPNLVDYDA
ncbi:hypothetical protein NMY22_g19966 [Coprinellus aureogranulatus]|nr:hypothetical protein NMY22_g19966 [Coprinellus aureogranulatus]